MGERRKRKQAQAARRAPPNPGRPAGRPKFANLPKKHEGEKTGAAAEARKWHKRRRSA